MKVVRLSALRTSRRYSPGNIPGMHFCQRLSRPQGHNVAGKIRPMKKSNDNTGNRTRDLPACSAVLNRLRHNVLHSSIKLSRTSRRARLQSSWFVISLERYEIVFSTIFWYISRTTIRRITSLLHTW